MLSHDAGEDGRGFDPSPVLMAFDRLPAGLRSHLAGNLSERFRSLDMLEDAGEVLRIAARSGVAADSNAQLASALVQKDENRKDDAYATLTGLTEQSHETSPRAMIELVSLKMSEDGSIDYDTAQMARILRKEHAESDLLPDLHFATVVALALSGAYAEALDELAGLRANIGADAFRQAQDFLHDRISRKAPDPVFLSAVLTLSPDALNELAPGTVFKAAKRLVALGFPDAAVDLLGPRFRGQDTPEGRLLRAEAYLHLGHADRAEADLSGLEGARADRLRATISEAKRDFVLAPDGNFPAPGGDVAEIPDKTAPLEFSRNRVDASADTRRRGRGPCWPGRRSNRGALTGGMTAGRHPPGISVVRLRTGPPVASASAGSCVTMSAGIARSRIWANAKSRIAARRAASSLENGSSSKSACGSASNVRISAARARCPPESVAGSRS